MGKVLSFDGWGKRAPDNPMKSQKSVSASMAPAGLLEDLFTGLNLHEVESDISLQLLKIDLHLKSLRGVISQKNVHSRREGLKEIDLADLHKWASNSTPNNWSAHPSYYRALIDEINSRSDK